MADEGDFVPEAGGSLEKLQEEVFLDDNQIKSGLSNLARSSNGRDYVYVSLDLIGKNLHTLDDIKTYQEIKYVNVKNNQLTSGSPLSDLANLVTANLQYNNITDFADMKSSSLQLLQLDNNKLTAIANSSFPALRALTLSKNIIPNLGDLSSFYPALEVLDLSGNKLTSLATLASLRSLKALNVCRNEINSLDGVKECKSLCKLLIESNKLPSVKELIKLQNLSNLVVVTIKGNMPMYEEIAEEEKIQQEVLILLPHIERINSREIGVEQRVEADTVAKDRIAEQEAVAREKAAEAEAEKLANAAANKPDADAEGEKAAGGSEEPLPDDE